MSMENPKNEYFHLFDLTKKTVIVTGGVGIQGQQICRGLAQYGATIAVVDSVPGASAELAAIISEESGAKLIGVDCDVSNPDDVLVMVNRVVEEFGKIDVLHNNAATKSKNPGDFYVAFEDFEFSVWRDIMSVNLDGMFLVAQAVGRQMIKQGLGGSIIQTASTYGVVGPDFRIYEGSHYMGYEITTPAAYSASKAAVIGLTKYLATYWGSENIRVNTLVPGGIESGQNDVFQEKYGSRVPLGRMAHASEMVGAVIFLASEASTYMTGQMLVVDGGWTAW